MNLVCVSVAFDNIIKPYKNYISDSFNDGELIITENHNNGKIQKLTTLFTLQNFESSITNSDFNTSNTKNRRRRRILDWSIAKGRSLIHVARQRSTAPEIQFSKPEVFNLPSNIWKQFVIPVEFFKSSRLGKLEWEIQNEFIFDSRSWVLYECWDESEESNKISSHFGDALSVSKLFQTRMKRWIDFYFVCSYAEVGFWHPDRGVTMGMKTNSCIKYCLCVHFELKVRIRFSHLPHQLYTLAS